MNRISHRNFPWHTFLFVPFVVFYLYAHNLVLVKSFMILRTLEYGVGSTVLLFFLINLLFKDRLKTGILLTIYLLLFFNYGVIYDLLENLYYNGLWPLQNIHRYLVSFFALFVIFLAYRFTKIKRPLGNITMFLNLILGMLLVFNLLSILNFNTQVEPNETGDLYQTHNTNNIKAKNDIYYIILDGYASNSTLKKFYNFDNSNFTNYLSQKGFQVLDSAQSNYYVTVQSLSSTLNMDYLQVKQSATARTTNLIRDNTLMKELKAFGYKIYNLKSGYSVTSTFNLTDSTYLINGPNEFEKGIMKYTMLRLDDLFGFFSHVRLQSQFQKMDEIALLNDSPKFCFIHIVAPHPPFVYDANGKQVNKKKFSENSWEPKQMYTDQLQFINKKVINFLEKISYNKNACIIIQSDHGPWITSNKADDVFHARSQILNAIKLPNDTLVLPRNSNSVNTFRYVLNSLVKTNFPILPNKADGEDDLRKSPSFTMKIIAK